MPGPAASNVVVLTAGGLLAGMLFSWPLWWHDARSSLPLLPVSGVEAFMRIPPFIQAGLLVIVAISTMIWPARRWPAAVLLITLIILILVDLNRLQTWAWLYALIFSIALIPPAERENEKAHSLRWLLAAVYVWGGFYKWTPYFAEDNFPWFCEAFAWLRPVGQFPALGYGLALFELSLGIGLLWRRTRPYFKWLAISFHVFIALSLSPLGLNWNLVAIPWNGTMAGLVWLLFREKEPANLPKHPALLAILGLAWVAPALQMVRAWPETLSWQMYSNTQSEATFYTAGGPPCAQLRTVWEKHAFDEQRKLLLDDWAQAELHTPLFTARTTFLDLGRYLCGCAAQPDSAGLIILTVNRWNRAGERVERIACRELR